jgi:hypothetical protein
MEGAFAFWYIKSKFTVWEGYGFLEEMFSSFSFLSAKG